MRHAELAATDTSAGDLSWPLRRACELYGSSDAFVVGAATTTYEELGRHVGALVDALDELKVPIGARVGFLGVNSLAHVECVIGVPSAGRVLVDLNFRLARAELELLASDCGIEVLVADRDRLDVARELRVRCPSLREIVLDATDPFPEDCLAYEHLVARKPAPMPAVGGDALAAISYTGGTTGSPKGVMLTHANLLANAVHNLIATGHGSEDRWLHVAPMFHVAGTANVFACTWVGAKQVVLPRFDPSAVLDTIKRERITHLILVPTMLGMLLDQLDQHDHESTGFPSLRHIQYAGSPISPALQRRALERFDCDIVQFYGMTEAAPTVTRLAAADHRRGYAGEEPYATRLRSIGTPVVGVEAEVRGPAGKRLRAGEIGELWVRGPNVMAGYWHLPAASTAVLVGDWYRTGDMARADGDGYLYLVDRLKDMIITGGENVYSVEVESVLADHSAVREAAVFGVPDARWGEAVYAVVVVDDLAAVSADELAGHCRTQIAGYKVPRTIELRTEPLPKSGAGKLLKQVLREPFWAGEDRRVH